MVGVMGSAEGLALYGVCKGSGTPEPLVALTCSGKDSGFRVGVWGLGFGVTEVEGSGGMVWSFRFRF